MEDGKWKKPRQDEFMADELKIETEWKSEVLNRSIPLLIAHTSKSLADATNQLALNVSSRALNKTPMADKVGMQVELGGQIAQAIRFVKKGKNKGKLIRGRKLRFSSAFGKITPLAALIVNARRGRSGKKGLYGKQMDKAINRMLGARKRSAGFLRSGWIPDIKELAAVLPNPFIMAHLKGVSVIGQRKGLALPAKTSLNPNAIIENHVRKITDLGDRALRDAMNEEGREIERHVNEKMQDAVKRFNERQYGGE